MWFLTKVLAQYGLDKTVLDGLAELTNSEKVQEIWETLGSQWFFTTNDRVVSRLGQCRYPTKGGFRCNRNGRLVKITRRDHGVVEIHHLLIGKGNEQTRDETILHEVAHAVNKMIFEYNDKHGPNWQKIMRAFKVPPSRCNTDENVSMLLREKKKAKINWIYACSKCEHKFPKIRRKKYPPENYSHTGCGGRLYLQQDNQGKRYPNPRVRFTYSVDKL